MIPCGTLCLCICGSPVLACNAQSINRIAILYCCLQAQLQSAADLGTVNGAPSSVLALQSALYAGQQREELHPQHLLAKSCKPWAMPFDSPYLTELDQYSSADTGAFQGPTSSDQYCPLSNEEWSHFARSSVQAETIGVNADGQLRRNAFDVRQLHQVFGCVAEFLNLNFVCSSSSSLICISIYGFDSTYVCCLLT